MPIEPLALQKWIADFWTAEGWRYVTAVIDLFSRRVVGWSMSVGLTMACGERQEPIARPLF